MTHTRPPMLRLHDDELIVDSFAGGGGASLGIEWALGRSPDIAINHDPEAIAMHQANHPHTKHYCESVWDVSPRKATGGRPVGLAWFSPDCFPAGTLVLTRKGYRPIEEIEVGDEVLTHKLRWRAVTEVSSTRRPLMAIKGHGHPGILVSPEHPFYVRQRKNVWRTEPRGYERTLEAADWAPASVLGKGWYWATPTWFPTSSIPPVPGRSMASDARLMWLAGRYLGDGWTRMTDTRSELVITCGRHEVTQLRIALQAWPLAGERSGYDELKWHERETGTAYQFSTNHRGLVEWLREHFGHRAEAKGIPAWALGMDESLKQALLDGYMSADGWDESSFCECSTVSKTLAFGLKSLLASIGKTVTVYTRANSDNIQGRPINARPYFKLRWRHDVDDAHTQTFREDGLEWCPVRTQAPAAVEADVFNIGVDEDESYIVEGIVVHNCKHFSKAKGGKPVNKEIRGLAWVVIRWARDVKPRVIILENVEEFQTWGPLLKNGKPCPARKGFTFRRWVNELKRLGYQVEHKELRACDYGAPTTRKRLFLIARCDGAPIIWPEATHGPGRPEPYRTAAECIDWSLPCPSIFNRERPLAENTLRRIARGIQRYVIESPDPFIIPLTHHGDRRVHPIAEPLPTVTGAHRGELALVSPTLVQTGYGEREGQAPRCLDIHQPLGTVVAHGQKHALVSAFLAKHYGGVVGTPLTRSIDTITSVDHHSVVACHLQRDFGKSVGSAPTDPLPTTTAGGGGKSALVASHMVKLRGGLDTHHTTAQDWREPAPTLTAGGTHLAEVRAFLVKYYGSDQDPQLLEPLHTITTRDRFGLVTVAGEDYVIADIGMRMLAPRELFTAQGFPMTYRIEIEYKGKPLSKTAQVRMCGNSVSPYAGAALVRANLGGGAAMDRTRNWEPGLYLPGEQMALFEDFLPIGNGGAA